MITNKFIIGIDPGLHTGFAVLDVGEFAAWEYTPMEACDKLDDLLTMMYESDRPNVRVSIERFTFQASSSKKSRQNDALEIIGAVRWICRNHSVPFTIVGAADASRVGSREVLTKLGWWEKGWVDHLQRAAAQVAFTFAQSHPDEFERLLNS